MSSDGWLDDAFFDHPENDAVDGGTTNRGLLWHAVASRWGHSMHTMCSYHGMFPAKLAHYFIQRFTEPGGLVADPFSGRGTTPLQARAEGRRALANDLNPLAYVLTRAKAAPPTWCAVNKLVDDLERTYSRASQRAVDVPSDIEMLYHRETLGQLTYLRDYLLRRSRTRWTREEYMIAGAMSGILHGAHRRDGTSQYLSISMPNTFSMSPAYVRKYIKTNKLARLDQDVFTCLRDKIARLYLDEIGGAAGTVTHEDAAVVLHGQSIKPESVDLVLTSPPYLRVVNYAQSNWIRLWWLGLDEVATNAARGRRALDAKLDHQHNYDAYCEFMLRTLTGVRRVLSKSGVAVVVIGDVATPGRPPLALAAQVWEDVGQGTGLRLYDLIEDALAVQNKVSRIWGDTKGQATDRDCVLVLARNDGEPVHDNHAVEWDEPYKDGGPDAAHARMRRARLTS